MKCMYFVFALSIGIVSSLKTKCLPPVGKVPFDDTRFSGDWYVVAAASTAPAVHPICNKLNYNYEHVGNVTKLHVKVIMKMPSGDETHMEIRGQNFKPGMTSVNHVAWKMGLDADQKFEGVAHSAILATDYDNYAVTEVCKEIYDEDEDTFAKWYIVSILSRKPTLDHTVIDTLKSVLTSFDFDGSSIVDLDNSGC